MSVIESPNAVLQRVLGEVFEKHRGERGTREVLETMKAEIRTLARENGLAINLKDLRVVRGEVVVDVDIAGGVAESVDVRPPPEQEVGRCLLCGAEVFFRLVEKKSLPARFWTFRRPSSYTKPAPGTLSKVYVAAAHAGASGDWCFAGEEIA